LGDSWKLFPPVDLANPPCFGLGGGLALSFKKLIFLAAKSEANLFLVLASLLAKISRMADGEGFWPREELIILGKSFSSIAFNSFWCF
jgi:hypothetical protein